MQTAEELMGVNRSTVALSSIGMTLLTAATWLGSQFVADLVDTFQNFWEPPIV